VRTGGSWFERHPRLTLAGVLVAIGLGAVVATEWGLSAIQSRENSLLGPPPEGRVLTFREYPVGGRFWTRPLSPTHVYPGGLEDRKYWVEIDSNGFLVPSRVHERASFEVVFLGGSTTECLFVSPEFRFPYQVGRLLEDSLGVAVNTYNGGRSGNVVLHSVLAHLAKVAPMRPKYVVLMENINDLAVLTHYGSYWNAGGRSFFPEATGPADRGGLVRRLKDGVSALFPSTYTAVASAWHRAMRGGGHADEFAAARDAVPASSAAEAERDFRRSLETFVMVVRVWGATPVLMTQASRFLAAPNAETLTLYEDATISDPGARVPYAEFHARYSRFNEVVREVANELAVPLIDLDRALHPDRTTMYDAVHYTDAGSRRVADVVAAALLSLERRDAAGAAADR
jgi:lysophospholipase L1-like esterase